jgi:hypothetical protein
VRMLHGAAEGPQTTDAMPCTINTSTSHQSPSGRRERGDRGLSEEGE